MKWGGSHDGLHWLQLQVLRVSSVVKKAKLPKKMDLVHAVNHGVVRLWSVVVIYHAHEWFLVIVDWHQ